MFKPSQIKSRREWRNWLTLAREKTNEARALDPSWSFTQSIARQLDFMESCVADGRTPTTDERKRTTLGLMAIRNLEESYPEYSTILQEVEYAFEFWDELPES